MRSFMIESIVDPVTEAQRYVQNAKDLLEEKAQLDTETKLYKDRKYVRMAGNTLWNGVLLILDATFQVKTAKRPHPKIKDYQEKIAKRDLKLLDLVTVGYETIRISMGYDGNPTKQVCSGGITLATDIINRCATMIA